MAKGRVQTDWSGLCRLIETSLTESKPAVTEDPGFWYLDNAGQPNGPVSSTELQTLFKGSRITAGTLVARRGDPGWVRLETVPGFATIVSVDGSAEAPAGTVVKCRRSHDFAIPMGVTLSFFFLLPRPILLPGHASHHGEATHTVQTAAGFGHRDHRLGALRDADGLG